MKLSYSTLPCEGWTIDKLIAYCKDYGFEGIEIREGHFPILLSMTTEQRRQAADAFAASGIQVTNLGSGICFTGDPERNEDHLLGAVRDNAHLASELGAKAIRIFLGYFAVRKDMPRGEIHYRTLVERLQGACDAASAFGVSIWIETHNEFSTGTVLHGLLDDVGRVNCAVIWDILHPLEYGETPEETLNALGDRCAHVHLKDGMPFDDPMALDWRYTVVGEGGAPIAEILRLLRKRDYKGYLSFEWETKWRTELQRPGMEAERAIPHFAAYINRQLKLLSEQVSAIPE